MKRSTTLGKNLLPKDSLRKEVYSKRREFAPQSGASEKESTLKRENLLPKKSLLKRSALEGKNLLQTGSLSKSSQL